MKYARRLLCLSILASVALPATALAATRTYCVTTPAAPPGCSGTNESTLTDALAAANTDSSGSDLIVLPAGTQTAINPYVYTGTVPLEIDGQGSSSIVTLIGGISNAAVFTDNNSSPAITLHALGVVIPTGSGVGADGIETFNTTSTTISDVTVTSNSQTVGAGIVLNGGPATISRTTVTMPANQVTANDGLVVVHGTATVSDSTFSGQIAVYVEVSGASASLDRCRLYGTPSNGLFVNDATATIDDSLLSSTNNTAIEAYTNAEASTITGTNLTIVPRAGTIGAAAVVAGNSNATVHLTGTILANPLQNSIYTERTSGTGIPTVTTSYSDYDPTTIVTYNSAAYVPGTGDVSSYVDPKFANPGASDFHLLASSPLLNFDPRALGIFDSPTDLDGFARPQAGPQDLGAYQHPPNPTVSASASVPSHSTIYPGTMLAFTSNGSEQYPNDTLTYSWKFDDGSTADGQNVNHSFASAGSHTATVTATDKYGFSGASSTSVVVTPTPPGPPKLGHLRESHRTWRAAKKTASISAKSRGRHHRRAPVGTVFTFTLDQKATVTMIFSPGRGHGFAYALMLSGHEGINHVAFYGRIKSPPHTLKPRRYTLNVKAFNAYGKASNTASIAFTIVR